MEKVKIPREVAEAIEHVWKEMSKGSYANPQHIILTNWGLLSSRYPINILTLLPFAQSNPMEYMSALVHGYEIEETPEEKVKKLFSNPPYASPHDEHIYRQGIEDTLDVYGFNIKGLNNTEPQLVTKEQAAALESVMTSPRFTSINEILEAHASNPSGWGGEWRELNYLPYATLSHILNYGFVVREDEEE